MRGFLMILACLSALILATSTFAQSNSDSRIVSVSQYHTTVGTATAAAIPSASVAGNIVSWKLCNDAVNTSTYLLAGFAVDAATDGVMMAPGACYVCENCQPAILKLLKVKAQAASNGYTVILYKH
jgi:hypothetical protein